jgi:DNA-binding transcriptional MerR regulator
MRYEMLEAPTSPMPRLNFTAPKKLYRIGEIMRHTGISRQTLHNYTVFGLITEEERTEAGHRLYGESVFSRLRKIEELKLQSKTLREIRLMLAQEDREA